MSLSTDYEFIKIDSPADQVLRITLDRPEARNALSNKLRGELFDALHKADQDDSVGVMIIRGDEKAFSAGYDLKMDLRENRPARITPHPALGRLAGGPVMLWRGLSRYGTWPSRLLPRFQGFAWRVVWNSHTPVT